MAKYFIGSVSVKDARLDPISTGDTMNPPRFNSRRLLAGAAALALMALMAPAAQAQPRLTPTNPSS
jgi:hypothetical protein